MAQKFYVLSQQTIDTAGTREAVSADALPVSAVVVQAPSTNSGNIFVGDSTVSSSKGLALAAGESITITSSLVNGTHEELILSDIYVDTATNGNKVQVSYLARR